jgi:hypothetical protein
VARSSLLSRLRVNAFGISIDGYGAGPDQALEDPMGAGGMALHQWVLGTKTFQGMAREFAADLIGDAAAGEGVDDRSAARGFGYTCTEHAFSDHAAHVVLTK